MSSSESERLAAARACLERVRASRAPAPGLDVQRLRIAYLELLKLCLCDLTGAGTTSVGRTADGAVMARELFGDQMRLRSAGMDWPLHGLTMVGLQRLDDLQTCVEGVVADGVAGDLIEAGAWRGGASILMRATLDTLDAGRTVFVADSFQGFPQVAAADRADDELDVFDFLAIAVEDVTEHFARFGLERGVRFVPGFFQDTMATLQDERWAIVRLDGDSYDATWLTLQSMYPRLSEGGYLIVDDYGALDECRQAVEEFRRHHELSEPLEQVDWTCVRWRRETDRPIGEPPVGMAATDGSSKPATPVARSREVHVPTVQEIELRRRVEELEQRLAGLQAELNWMQGSPLRAPRAWLRTKLGQDG